MLATDASQLAKWIMGKRHEQVYKECAKEVHQSFGWADSSVTSPAREKVFSYGFLVVYAVDIYGMLSVLLWGSFYIDVNNPGDTSSGAPYYYVRNAMYYRMASFACIHVCCGVMRIYDWSATLTEKLVPKRLALLVLLEVFIQTGAAITLGVTSWEIMDEVRLSLAHVPRIALEQTVLQPDGINATLIDCLTGAANNCNALSALAMDPAIVDVLAGVSDHSFDALGGPPDYSADYILLADAFSKIDGTHPVALTGSSKSSHKGGR